MHGQQMASYEAQLELGGCHKHRQPENKAGNAAREARERQEGFIHTSRRSIDKVDKIEGSFRRSHVGRSCREAELRSRSSRQNRDVVR